MKKLLLLILILVLVLSLNVTLLMAAGPINFGDMTKAVYDTDANNAVDADKITEADPVVGAVSGVVCADGAGGIAECSDEDAVLGSVTTIAGNVDTNIAAAVNTALGAAYDTEAELKALMPITQTISLANTDVLTPTAGYKWIDINATCTTNPTSTITVAETGAIETATMRFRNVGTYACAILYAANNFEHKGGTGKTMTIAAGDSFEAKYSVTLSKWTVTVNNTSTTWVSSLTLPTTTSGDQTLTVGQIGIKTDEDAIVIHGGAAGEVQDEAVISLIQHTAVAFDPTWVYDQSAAHILPLFYIGDDFPHGLTLVEWKLTYVTGDPTTELGDGTDLYCDTTPDWAIGTNATKMDDLDTTSGASAEDSTFVSATCANAANIYISLGTDPVDSNVLVMFEMWYYANED